MPRPLILALLALTLAGCAATSAEIDAIAKRHGVVDANQQNADIRDGFPEKGNAASATHETISVGGATRGYLLQAPDGDGPFPILILLHGAGGTAANIWEQSSLPTLAAAHDFIIAAPEAVDGQWNDGNIASKQKDKAAGDDVAFLQALIARLVADHRGGADAVFMVGSASGGAMTMRYACAHAETLRGAATVLAAMPAALSVNCRPARPLAWLQINGTEDRIIPFGGQATTGTSASRPALLSPDATFRFWADADNCAAQYASVKLPHNGKSYDIWAEQRTRQNCANGTATYYVLHGSGHAWPGLANDSLTRMQGGANRDIDAGTTIMDFFGADLP